MVNTQSINIKLLLYRWINHNLSSAVKIDATPDIFESNSFHLDVRKEHQTTRKRLWFGDISRGCELEHFIN